MKSSSHASPPVTNEVIKTRSTDLWAILRLIVTSTLILYGWQVVVYLCARAPKPLGIPGAILAIIAVLWLHGGFRGGPAARTEYRARRRIRPIGPALPWILLAVPAYQIFALCATRLWLHFLGDPTSGGKLLITPSGPYSWMLIALLTATFAPILEELVMRGRLQTALERSLRPAVAILLTALTFAGIHLSLVGFPIAFIHGLVFGAVVNRTGSVWTSVILHMANNMLLVPISIFGLFGLEHALSAGAVALITAVLVLALGALAAVGWRIWRLPSANDDLRRVPPQPAAMLAAPAP